MKLINFWIAIATILSLPIPSPQVLAQEWDCQTSACEGHKAGYKWAMNHFNVTERDCDIAGETTDSASFSEGCKTGLIAKRKFGEVSDALAPLFQAIHYGEMFAKETRALPSDCDEAYNALIANVSNTSLWNQPFRNGCLEVARKQAKRIMKEDEKSAKAARKAGK